MSTPHSPIPSLRTARGDDEPVLWEMLGHAANWDTAREPLDVRSVPEMAHYVQGWSPDQGGIIAEVGTAAVGAAWLRLLPVEDPGYGFWAPGVPELSIGIAEDHRGHGVGRALIEALTAQALERGHEQISLSVEPENRAAVALYEKTGFAHTGRIVGDSEVMVAAIRPHSVSL